MVESYTKKQIEGMGVSEINLIPFYINNDLKTINVQGMLINGITNIKILVGDFITINFLKGKNLIAKYILDNNITFAIKKDIFNTYKYIFY